MMLVLFVVITASIVVLATAKNMEKVVCCLGLVLCSTLFLGVVVSKDIAGTYNQECFKTFEGKELCHNGVGYYAEISRDFSNNISTIDAVKPMTSVHPKLVSQVMDIKEQMSETYLSGNCVNLDVNGSTISIESLPCDGKGGVGYNDKVSTGFKAWTSFVVNNL